MKKIALSILMLSTIISNAQTNVIKLNLFALGLTNISMQYERTISEHSSVALGLSMLPSRGLPSAAINADSSGTLKGLTFSGWSITPEYRYYFSGKAPKGFYVAPYFRYSKYSIDKVGVTYASSVTNQDETVFVDGSFKTTVIGLMLGSQWLLGEHVTLDWWIIGAGFGSATATVTGSGNFDATQRADLTHEMETFDVPGTVTATVTSNSISAEYKTGLPAFRGFGLCLGYKF